MSPHSGPIQGRKRKPVSRRTFLRGTLAAGTVLATHPWALVAEAGRAKVRLVQPPTPLNVATYNGIEKKIFEKAGIEVEVLQVAGGREVVRMFSTATLKTAITAPGVMGITVGKGVPAKILSFIGYGGVAVVAFNPAVKKVSDLKGKTISISGVGSLSESMSRLAMHYHGFNSHKEAKLRPMPAPEMISAGRLGHIDAACIWTPYTEFMLMEIPNARVLVNADDAWRAKYKTKQSFPNQGVIVYTELLEKYPQTFIKFREALAESARFLKRNPEEVMRLSAKYFKWKRKHMEYGIRRGTWPTFTEGGLTEGDKIGCRQVWDFMLEVGYIKKPVPQDIFWEGPKRA